MTIFPVEFAPGQRWAYRTRSGEEASRLLVLKVETVNGEDVVHISIDGLAMKNPLSPDGVSRQLGHTPVSAQALRCSLTHLEASGAELPEDDSGYRQWKAASDRGEAGVFTLEVADLVDAMEQALDATHPQSNVFGKSNRRA